MKVARSRREMGGAVRLVGIAKPEKMLNIFAVYCVNRMGFSRAGGAVTAGDGGCGEAGRDAAGERVREHRQVNRGFRPGVKSLYPK